MRFVLGYLVVGIVAWMAWASHFSVSATRCFAKGGTHFDPLGWSCHKHEVIE